MENISFGKTEQGDKKKKEKPQKKLSFAINEQNYKPVDISAGVVLWLLTLVQQVWARVCLEAFACIWCNYNDVLMKIKFQAKTIKTTQFSLINYFDVYMFIVNINEHLETRVCCEH